MDDYFCLKGDENLKQSWYICMLYHAGNIYSSEIK